MGGAHASCLTPHEPLFETTSTHMKPVDTLRSRSVVATKKPSIVSSNEFPGDIAAKRKGGGFVQIDLVTGDKAIEFNLC